jgi:hypothetical protein
MSSNPLLVVASNGGAGIGKEVMGQLSSEFVAEVTKVGEGGDVTLMVGRAVMQAKSNVPLEAGQKVRLKVDQASDGTVHLKLISSDPAPSSSKTSVVGGASTPQAVPEEVPVSLPARLPGQPLEMKSPLEQMINEQPGTGEGVIGTKSGTSSSTPQILIEEDTLELPTSSSVAKEAQAPQSSQTPATSLPRDPLLSPARITIPQPSLASALRVPISEAGDAYPISALVTENEESTGTIMLQIGDQIVKATSNEPLPVGTRLVVLPQSANGEVVVAQEIPAGSDAPASKQAMSKTLTDDLAPQIGERAAKEVAAAVVGRAPAERSVALAAARFLAQTSSSPTQQLREATINNVKGAQLLQEIESQATSGEGTQLTQALKNIGIDQENRLLKGTFAGETLKTLGGPEAQKIVSAQQILASRPSDLSQLAASLFFLPLPGGEARFSVEGDSQTYPHTPARIKGELNLSALGDVNFDVIGMPQGLFAIVGSNHGPAVEMMKAHSSELEEALKTITGKPVVLTITSRPPDPPTLIPARSDDYA